MKKLTSRAKLLVCLSVVVTMTSSMGYLQAFAMDTPSVSVNVEGSAENDYYTVGDTGSAFAKKSGCYALVCKGSDESFSSLTSAGNDGSKFHDVFSDAVFFGGYSEKDSLGFQTKTANGATFWLVYCDSSDPEIAKTDESKWVVIELKTDIEEPVKVDTAFCPQFTWECTSSTDSEYVIHVKANTVVEEGSDWGMNYLEGFAIYDTDGNRLDNVDTSTLWSDFSTSAEFDYTFGENGNYIIRITDSNGLSSSCEINITALSGEPLNEGDLDGPKVTLNLPDQTGLSDGVDGYTFGVTTDEEAQIGGEGFDLTDFTTSADFEVFTNGEYPMMATDKLGNTTEFTVTVTAFGDGSLDYTDPDPENTNPYTEEGRDTLWEDLVAGGLYDEDGTKIEPTANVNPSDSMDKLPQTGLLFSVVRSAQSVQVFSYCLRRVFLRLF